MEESWVTSKKMLSPAASGSPLMLAAVALYETELPPITMVPEFPDAALSCIPLGHMISTLLVLKEARDPAVVPILSAPNDSAAKVARPQSLTLSATSVSSTDTPVIGLTLFSLSDTCTTDIVSIVPARAAMLVGTEAGYLTLLMEVKKESYMSDETVHGSWGEPLLAPT
jgi:hypothetical protein